MIEHLKKIGVFSVMIVLSTGIVFSGCKEEEEDKTGIQLLTVLGLAASNLLSGTCMQVVKTEYQSKYTVTPIGVPRGGCNVATLQGATRAAAVTISATSLARQKAISEAISCTGATTVINGQITANTEASKATTEALYARNVIGNMQFIGVSDAIAEIKIGIQAAIAVGSAGQGIDMPVLSIDNSRVMKVPSETDPFAVAVFAQAGGGLATCKNALFQAYPHLQQVPTFFGSSIGQVVPMGQTNPDNAILPAGGNGRVYCQYGAEVTTTCATFRTYFADGASGS